MAKKKSDRRPSPPNDQIEEFGEDIKGADKIIEYSPESESAQVHASVDLASETSGRLAEDEGLLKAKEELIARLGGSESLSSAAAVTASADRVGAENIQAIGVGLNEKRGRYTGDLAVKVFVREKLPLPRLAERTVVPETINGYPTDVEVVGEITIDSYARRYARPVPCGVSVGHPQITAGTLGSLMVLDNNRLCLLSNNHVLSNSNRASIGDAILQPGASDGGRTPTERIGVLERFVSIHFPGPNLVDAAAAWTAFRLVDPEHVTYTVNPGPLAPLLGLTVVKNGRTTQATMGLITAISVDSVRVNYRPEVAIFNNQIIVRGVGGAPFSLGGDSGALIVSADAKRPVGLLFAGSTTHTIANPIDAVISQLGIQRFLTNPD